MARFYPHPDTKKMIPEKEYREIMSRRREDKSTPKYRTEFHLKGGGFPSKGIKMRNKQRKALERNPNHTTLSDYKFENPNSIPSKALKKNKKKLEKAGIEIKKNVTKK